MEVPKLSEATNGPTFWRQHGGSSRHFPFQDSSGKSQGTNIYINSVTAMYLPREDQ